MNIKFELTIDESNQILGALGDQPYAKVADLIVKIRNQAMAQINAANAAAPGTAEEGAADHVRAATQAVVNS
jgi:hypothetical protein